MKQGKNRLSEVLNLTLKNDIAEFHSLTPAVSEFLEKNSVASQPAFVVNLAIEEMVLNVMRYAFDDEESHLIDFRLSVDEKQVVLRIEDDGVPFDPRSAPAPDFDAPIEERRIGGLGVHLVEEMAETLDYERVGGRNCVEVCVRRS